MIDVSQIPLAAKDFDGIEVLVILAFVVISIISGLIQKANKAKKQREEQAKAPQRPRQAKPSPRPSAGAEGLQVLQAQAGVQTVPQIRPPRQQQARPPAGRGTRRRGLKPKKTSIESRRTGSAHVGRLDHVEKAEVAAGPAVQIDLSAREAARQAIIFHEIFSAPKALRQGAEMWEM